MKTFSFVAAGLIALATLPAMAETNLRIASEEGFADPPKVAAQSALQYIEAELPKATNGEVTVTLYPNGALGTEKELIKAVADGTVDAIVLSVGNAASIVPEVQLFSASYLFESYDHARATLADPAFFAAMQKIVADRNTGFQLEGIGLTGSRNYYSRTKPIATVEDLEGVKMRVMSSPTEFEVWSTLGTMPTTIPAPEIYTSLQTGVIDSAESSLPAISGSKYYEVAPYISLTHHQYNIHLFLVSDVALARLDEAQKAALQETFRAAGLLEVESAIALTAKVLEDLKTLPGVQVNEVDIPAFAEKLRPIQDKTAEELGMVPLLEMIRSFR
ncbi:MAG: TRAP transporter substrate-binding protein [Paracoccaceae bacterium]